MTRVFRLILLLMITSSLPVAAKVFTFTELNCRCEVPDSWYFQDTPGDLVDVIDNDHKRYFGLRVKPVNRSVTLDNKEFIRGLEESLATRGFNITGRSTVLLQGVKFYKLNMQKDLGNRSLYECLYVTMADGRGYSMELSDYSGNPDEDADLKAMVDSFNFLRPPLIHQAFSWETFLAPKDGLPHDAVYLTTYRITTITLLCLLVASPFFFLALVGFGIYWLVRQSSRSSRPSSSYPSSQPSTPSAPRYAQLPPRRGPPSA